MKKIAILYSEYTPVIDAIKHYNSDTVIDCFKDNLDNKDYDLVILVNFYGKYNGNALACHYSLIPNFDETEPVKQALLEGLKVTGITIYYTYSKKIIAQYPIFINNNMYYDELLQELKYLEQTIFPIVTEKIIKNEQFDSHLLINKRKTCHSCSGGCSSCNH